MPLLILLLIVLGIYAEFAVIIEIGSRIGAATTLFAMVMTAILGIWLVRLQGFEVYRKMNASMAKGETPVNQMMHGLLLLLAGFLLIIPGFISDGLGALLLLPPVRSLLISLGISKQTKVFFTWRQQSSQHGITIEGEYTKEEERKRRYREIGDKKK